MTDTNHHCPLLDILDNHDRELATLCEYGVKHLAPKGPIVFHVVSYERDFIDEYMKKNHPTITYVFG